MHGHGSVKLYVTFEYTRSYKNSRAASRYGPPLRTEYRVIVENLSSRVSWQVCIFVNFIDFVLP